MPGAPCLKLKDSMDCEFKEIYLRNSELVNYRLT